MSAENIIADFGLYLAIAVPFGIAMGGADFQNLLSTIFSPWPTLQSVVQPLPHCGDYDFSCQAQSSIAQATSFIAVPFLWMGALVLSLLQRISAFGQIGEFITFGPTQSLAAIPGAPLIITVFVIIIVFELFRMFRGSSVGA